MIVDLYAGPGGWSEGLRSLGHGDVGIEMDAAACATRAAAGHRTIRGDVAAMPLDHLAGRVGRLIASPPCQAFSAAGNGEGRALIHQLRRDIEHGDWARPGYPENVRHVLEVGRWAEALRPRWITCEQVPPVMPLWVSYARRFRAAGYSTWAGILNAADYGVPQTRRRAILLASLDRVVGPPAPTHIEGGADTLFGALRPWVSMAEALGLEADGWGARQLRGAGMIERHGERHDRPVTDPAPTVRANGGSNGSPGFVMVRTGANSMVTGRTGSRAGDGDVQPYERPITEPAPTVDTKAGSSWVFERPATTIVADGRAFGPHAGSAGEPQSTNAIRLDITDALILQSFPPDYPVQGNKTKQFEQVGNAVPPPLAAAVLAQVLDDRREVAA